MKKKDLALGRINESRDLLKKYGEFEMRPEFYYCLTNLPYHIRQSKHYKGFYTLYISALPVYVDCNHVEIVNEVEIPKVTCKDTIIKGEVIVLKKLLADRVREHFVKNKAMVKPKVTIERIINMGLIDELKRKHREAKPGRDLWDYEADEGNVRIFKVQDKREVETKLGMSPIFDILDVETDEELSVWGLARLVNAFEAEGVYAVEYNGKSKMKNNLEAHSFFITDVTKEYEEGKKKGKK